ncbi:Pentatricopeptide repeat-containing protein [Spatholobus suberectus]|nr:Pentatricopeptide repeat-containing protein [Spatholobus suberectus]
MDFFMLITTYGKVGDFNSAEKILGLMNKNGYPPNVVSQTALMEAYGKGGRYNNVEAIFCRMQKWGPEPSALTYQIILKTFVQEIDDSSHDKASILEVKAFCLLHCNGMFGSTLCLLYRDGMF